MKQALKQVKRQSYQIQIDGIVMRRENDGVTIDSEYGELFVRRAVSCLV